MNDESTTRRPHTPGIGGENPLEKETPTKASKTWTREDGLRGCEQGRKVRKTQKRYARLRVIKCHGCERD